MGKNGKVRKELLIRTEDMTVLRWLAKYKGVDVATLMYIYLKERMTFEMRQAKQEKWPPISGAVQKIIERW